MPKPKYPIDFDNNWKEVMAAMTPDFLSFFMPKLYADIDFNYPIDFLEQELYDVVQLLNKEKVVDKLVRVRLKTGEDKWILIHIEFQTGAESDFSKRMYHYFRLIRAKYEQDVTALAIYTGKRKPRLFDHYKEENYGYSETKIAHLLLFINDLMRLTPTFEYIFKQHISEPYNPKPIMHWHQSTIDVVDIETRNVYGVSIPEARAEARAEAEAETRAQVEGVQTKLQKSVVLLYTKVAMSIENIAQELGETPANVRDILVTANVDVPKIITKRNSKSKL